jgi:uncharacterized membrane protein
MRALRGFRAFGKPLLWSVMALGAGVIGWASLVYFNDEDLPPFMVEKLPLPFEDMWLAALRVHVVAAVFALLACLLLTTKWFLRRAPRLHRYLGRTTGVVVLFALAPSGFYLSLWARGGLPSTLGFILSGLIVVVAMVQGIRTARAGDFVAHRRNGLHVLAQLSVAVTSRTMLIGLNALNVDSDRAYLASLWLPVIAGVVLVELLVPRRPSRRDHVPMLEPRLVDGSDAGLRRAA